MRRVLNQKLYPKYFSHFLVLKKVGQVAYTLQLPPSSYIHPTFHLSQLKKHIRAAPFQAQFPLVGNHEAMRKEPVRILEGRMVKKGNQASIDVLVE